MTKKKKEKKNETVKRSCPRTRNGPSPGKERRRKKKTKKTELGARNGFGPGKRGGRGIGSAAAGRYLGLPATPVTRNSQYPCFDVRCFEPESRCQPYCTSNPNRLILTES